MGFSKRVGKGGDFSKASCPLSSCRSGIAYECRSIVRIVDAFIRRICGFVIADIIMLTGLASTMVRYKMFVFGVLTLKLRQ